MEPNKLKVFKPTPAIHRERKTQEMATKSGKHWKVIYYLQLSCTVLL